MPSGQETEWAYTLQPRTNTGHTSLRLLAYKLTVVINFIKVACIWPEWASTSTYHTGYALSVRNRVVFPVFTLFCTRTL